MGHGLRSFSAEDDSTLTRVPAVKCGRWFDGDEVLPADWAGRELRLLEVVVEVERRRVVDVLRILPVRHQVGEGGRLDMSAAMRRAQKRLGILWRLDAGDASARIDQLEADANSFWWPTDRQLEALGTALLGRPPDPAQCVELRAVLFRLGDASGAEPSA